MANISKKPYKGTRDFYPSQMRVRDYIFKVMEETAFSFGYEHYDGPLIEELDLYRAKSGEELVNEQLYSFKDRGSREVAIRPEMTPTLARMVANIHKEESKPLRWFSIPNVMRYERPQKGRLREHWQLNCDIFGAPDLLGEIELLQLIICLLERFGANEDNFELLLNDRQVVDQFFKKVLKVDDEKSYRLYKIIDKSKKISSEKLNEEINKLKINNSELFNQYLRLKSFDESIQFFKSQGLVEEVTRLSRVQSYLKELKISHYIKYDPCIVRGLDYYTGLVFEVFDKHPDNRRAICGGGTYANLLQIFNEAALPGTGFGMGDVTLTDFLVSHNLMPELSKAQNDLFLASSEEESSSVLFQLAQSLRSKKVKVLTNLGALKLNKVLSHAQRKGAKFSGVIGSNELTNKSIIIKNIETKASQEFKFDDVDGILAFLRK